MGAGSAVGDSAAGTLAGQGKLSWTLSLLLCMLATVNADYAWFEFGRRRGARVLELLCRISLEPDSCVRQAENSYYRYGPRVLLIAKFIPGLNTVAPPVAGIFRLPRWQFLLYSAGAAALWAGAYLGLGYIFSDQLELALVYASRLGEGLAGLAAAGIAGFILVKWVQRRRFMQTLATNRIQPEELKQRLDSGVPVVIVDLRHALDSLPDPRTLPGALRMEPSELELRHNEIPADAEVVLYCT